MRTLQVDFSLPTKQLGYIIDYYKPDMVGVPNKRECIGFIKMFLFQNGTRGIPPNCECSTESLSLINKYKINDRNCK